MKSIQMSEFDVSDARLASNVPPNACVASRRVACVSVDSRARALRLVAPH